jgi:hypothetical protein
VSWDSTFPTALVVACSDGRTHAALDTFLRDDLHIERYDQLYVPGGAGALAASGIEFTRAHQYRRECRFLVEAHRLDTVVLLFHGPAADASSDALCGDYRRKFPKASNADIRDAQDQDLRDILGLPLWRNMRVIVARHEVTGDGHVRFIILHDSAEHKQ